MATKKMPATLRKYQALRKKKKAHCAGRATKTALNKAVSDYVKSAVAGGQSKTEAQAKANKVLRAACGVSGLAGKRKAAPKRKATGTGTRKRTTTTASPRRRARA